MKTVRTIFTNNFRYFYLVGIILLGMMVIIANGGCGGGGTSSDTHTPTTGLWKASTDFGDLKFTVNSDGTAVTEVSYVFSSWTCGSSTKSGTIKITNASGWPITDRQFTIENDLNPDPSISEMMTITGTFDQSGNKASGTWEADLYDAVCSGTWQASPISDNDTSLDNSRFYGTFNITFTETKTCPNSEPLTSSETGILTIESDSSKRAEDDYIYIPSSESSETYSYTDEDGDIATETVTISNNTIRLEETGECSGVPSPCWRTDILATFNNTYTSATIEGSGFDYTGCQYDFTGSLTRADGTCTGPTTMTVRLAGVAAGTTLGGLDITIDYDEAKVSFSSVAAGTLTPGATIIPNDNGDTVRVGLIKADGFDGAASGSVVVLTFDVIEPNIPTIEDFTATVLSASDLTGFDAGLDSSNINITISNK